MMEILMRHSIVEPRMGLVSPVSTKYCHCEVLQRSNLNVTVAGDVIGCGIDFVLRVRKAFFTKNGAFLGESTTSLLLASSSSI